MTDLIAKAEAWSDGQRTALEYAASDSGGWPRAKANERSWAIRSYRALERQGFVQEIPLDAQTVRGEQRLHFVATEAGRALRRAMAAKEGM